MHRTLVLTVLTAVLIVGSALPSGAQPEDFVMVFVQPAAGTSFQDDFGHAKPDGRRHQGIDVFGEHGAPVVAVADGQIRRMQHSPRSGYYIVIDHADDVGTWYMHLNNDDIGTNNGRGGPNTAFADGLAVGDYVSAGQVIGYVGNSGNAEGTHHHTHFELRINNRPVNPYTYLTASQERWELEAAIDSGETPFS